ncbi:hypothetical protein OMCYN_01479 [cyanobiont of Ornithocercus magnificus]|nr:hypothetical protein OMCYN_01479 [cyanobiont of Ornithocercus magnificus]
MDSDLTLPLLGGGLLVLVIVAGTLAVLLRPSDTPEPPSKR